MSDTSPEKPPQPPQPSRLQRLNSRIRDLTGRHLNLWSVLTLVSVLLIIVLCAVLWDIENFRPVLATVGAGLAAFLAPIPSILSPDLRSKWLVSVLVSALIAAGTWFATQDLANRLQTSTTRADMLDARLRDNKATFAKLWQVATPETVAAMQKQAAGELQSLFDQSMWEEILDLAQPLAKVNPKNGTNFAYEAYAYRALGNTGEAKRALENYLALAQGIERAQHGPKAECYADPDGFCGERTGWLSHLRAAIAVREAESETIASKKRKYLAEAWEHEMRNILIPKWRRASKDEGFDSSKEEPLSSCEVLEHVIVGFRALGRSRDDVVAFRKEKLKCG